MEITNICNLACDFCPGTRRTPATMTAEQFRSIARRLRGQVGYLYLHVLGEPLLHPDLPTLLDIAGAEGFRVCLTTNGTLLPRRGEELLGRGALHKVSVSLHAAEGNGIGDLDGYLNRVWDFAQKAAQSGVIVSLRLWNQGGAQERNDDIYAFLERQVGAHPLSLPQPRAGSFRLSERLYLEQAARFDWPDLAAQETDTKFCLALRDQAAVLVDGTVVPCCLDHEGDIPLGKLPEQSLEEILSSPRAKALYQGFSQGKPSEALCRRCGFATRFG